LDLLGAKRSCLVMQFNKRSKKTKKTKLEEKGKMLFLGRFEG
jgi:hypothetical protein